MEAFVAVVVVVRGRVNCLLLLRLHASHAPESRAKDELFMRGSFILPGGIADKVFLNLSRMGPMSDESSLPCPVWPHTRFGRA